MRNNTLKISIAVLTFSIGLGVFYLWFFQLPIKSEQNVASEIAIADSNKPDSPEDFDPWKLPDDFLPLEKGDFFPIGHACGDGYIDGWLAYDGSHLSEGFNPISRKDFDDEIAKAGNIVEKVENYPNRDGKKGLRIVLQGKNERTGTDYFSIIWFGKWYKKDYGRYFLNGPNLEIALKLEKKLIKDSQRNNVK
ncbi:MAG: hypothetical protein ABI891_00695 [Acidobacteriota bacterium]